MCGMCCARSVSGILMLQRLPAVLSRIGLILATPLVSALFFASFAFLHRHTPVLVIKYREHIKADLSVQKFSGEVMYQKVKTKKL